MHLHTSHVRSCNGGRNTGGVDVDWETGDDYSATFCDLGRRWIFGATFFFWFTDEARWALIDFIEDLEMLCTLPGNRSS